MILHEVRSKPMPLLVALCTCLVVGCEVHENVFSSNHEVSVVRGSAVSPWKDAQTVMRPDDADAALDGSEPLDAALADAALDGAAAAAVVDDFSEIEAPCGFRVTTLSLGGQYAPRNIGAIWIERADGTWLKTLAVWAGVRLRYLAAYRAANPTGNKVDAITSGTRQVYGDRIVGWNLADATGNIVPDGDYAVRVEITDKDATGTTFAMPFTKVGTVFMNSAPDAQYFTHAVLRCR